MDKSVNSAVNIEGANFDPGLKKATTKGLIREGARDRVGFLAGINDNLNNSSPNSK